MFQQQRWRRTVKCRAATLGGGCSSHSLETCGCIAAVIPMEFQKAAAKGQSKVRCCGVSSATEQRSHVALSTIFFLSRLDLQWIRSCDSSQM